ncbi:ATP-grasp domain-containing protein [Flavobacterium jejuense]|uniref:ATP-grasp domain-containing protein n=1 Tax=Flavobacterium jejuense TaxID=1544455 RepID=A0ABX0ISP3_9FLAO|nr:ATP-grasp domain-containing protein [Flavobacterium jejuense]NHN25136.1 ATP-grasp domain-containing protein [Flavobacterium jejuense]
MTKIALLACEKFPNLTPSDRLLIPALAKHNIQAKAEIWDNPSVDWTTYDYLIFRNTWDYYEKEKEFNLWLTQIEKLGIKTLNSIDTIQQNKHKFYLKDLQKNGVTIIPTLFQEKTNSLDLKAIIPEHWKKIVIKPAFSAGSYLTEVFQADEIESINSKYHSIAVEKELLIQEFKPEITSIGETSFIFFNKQFSHCVNKKPAANDFRIQVQYGGKYTLIQPSKELIQQAQEIINLFPDNLLYVRVDGIIINNKIHLMEVECIEPDLYLNLAPTSIEKFTTSILELIK